MSKHSPSPWKCEHYTKGMWTIYSKIDKEDEIAICRTYTDNKNAEMDAYLIAAAPDLLTACKVALSSCDPHAASYKYIAAAIEKAEGK